MASMQVELAKSKGAGVYVAQPISGKKKEEAFILTAVRAFLLTVEFLCSLSVLIGRPFPL